jgi:hypothetical protein
LVVLACPVDRNDSSLAHSSFDSIDLFPLTDDWRIIRSSQEHFRSFGKTVNLLPAARLIDDEVTLLGNKLPAWSADLGARRLTRKSLKEEFLVPDEQVSAWWFSLLSEKNPLKTEVFRSEEHTSNSSHEQ